MIIVPKASVTSFLLGYGYHLDHFTDLLQRLQVCFKMRNNDPDIRELIVQTCQNHLTQVYGDHRTKDLFLGPIALAAIFIVDQKLFRHAVRSFTDSFDKSTYSALGEHICLQTPGVPENE